jgi:protein-disulfide isomerase
MSPKKTTKKKTTAVKKPVKKTAVVHHAKSHEHHPRHISRWWVFWTYLFGVILIGLVVGSAYVLKYPDTVKLIDNQFGANIIQENVDAFCLESLFQSGDVNVLQAGDFVYKRYPGKVIQTKIVYDSACAECLSPSIENSLAANIPTAVISKVDARKEGLKDIIVNSLPYIVFDQNIEQTGLLAQFGNKIEKQGNSYLLSTLALDPGALRTSVNKIDLGNSPSIGSVNAPLTMVQFIDFECEPCKVFYRENFEQLKKDFIDNNKLRFVVKDLPVDEIHDNARLAANAARCAGEQGKYFEMYNKLLSSTESFDTSSLQVLANGLGIANKEFVQCLASDTFNESINTDIATAKKAGATTMPSYLVGDKIISGNMNYESLKNLINRELSQLGEAIERPSGGQDLQDEPVKGNADAMEIRFFGDFTSNETREAAKTLKEVYEIYNGKIKLSFTNLPGNDEFSNLAAQAGECAQHENAFWPLYDLLFDNQAGLNRDTIERLGRQIGLGSLFISCVRVGDYVKEITHDIDTALSFGITTTPSYVFNSQTITGLKTVDEWKELINAVVSKQAQTNQ